MILTQTIELSFFEKFAQKTLLFWMWSSELWLQLLVGISDSNQKHDFSRIRHGLRPTLNFKIDNGCTCNPSIKPNSWFWEKNQCFTRRAWFDWVNPICSKFYAVLLLGVGSSNLIHYASFSTIMFFTLLEIFKLWIPKVSKLWNKITS